MKVRRRDTGAWVTCGKRNFIGQGGEGAVYADGEFCIKLYSDPAAMIPEGKIRELSTLATESILAPIDVVLERDTPRGYVMRQAKRCYPLPAIMPRAWRSDKGFDTACAMKAVLDLREKLEFIHSRGALAVDQNEMNFLLRDTLEIMVGIDVDSYQTPSYPATAILPIVRDPTTKSFTEETDWYSFGLLAFALIIGAHPFKGRHPDFKRGQILERMAAGESALRPRAKLPPTCQPLDSIPAEWRTWFETVFHTSERPRPPGVAGRAGKASPQAVVESRDLQFSPLPDRPAGLLASGQTPLGREVLVFTEAPGRVTVHCGAAREAFGADEVSSLGGRIYLRRGEDLLEMGYLEIGRVRFVPQRVGSLSEHSSRLYRGVAIQGVLGAAFVSVLSGPGRCVQMRLKELEGRRIVAANFAGGGGRQGETGVLRVATELRGDLELHTWCGLERSSFRHYWSERVDVPSVEAAELDTGVAVVSHEDGAELFYPGKPAKRKLIKNSRLAGARLSSEGGSLVATAGHERYAVRMR